MLRTILIFFTIAVAFWLQLLFSQIFFIAGFPIPLIAVVLFLWSWKLDLGERIFWGVGTGIFLDSVYPEFFGTYMTTFFILAFLIGLLRSYLSSTGPFFTAEVALFSYLFIFVLLIYFSSQAFSFFYQTFSSWVGISLKKVLLAAFLWSLLLAVFYGGLLRLGRVFIGSRNRR